MNTEQSCINITYVHNMSMCAYTDSEPFTCNTHFTTIENGNLSISLRLLSLQANLKKLGPNS